MCLKCEKVAKAIDIFFLLTKIQSIALPLLLFNFYLFNGPSFLEASKVL